MASTIAEALREIEGIEYNKIGCSEQYIDAKKEELAKEIKKIASQNNNKKEMQNKETDKKEQPTQETDVKPEENKDGEEKATAEEEKAQKTESLKDSIKIVGHVNMSEYYKQQPRPPKTQQEQIMSSIEHMIENGKNIEHSRDGIIKENAKLPEEEKKEISSLGSEIEKVAKKQIKHIINAFPNVGVFTSEMDREFASVLTTAGFLGAGLENNLSEKSLDVFFRYKDDTTERKNSAFKMSQNGIAEDEIDFCMEHENWSEEQLEQARLGFKHNIEKKDIEWYMQPNFSMQMKKEIRTGLELGLARGQIFAYIKKDLSHNKIDILRRALKKNVNTQIVDEVSKIGLSTRKLKEVFNGLDEKATMEEVSIYANENLSIKQIKDLKDAINDGVSLRDVKETAQLQIEQSMADKEKMQEKKSEYQKENIEEANGDNKKDSKKMPYKEVKPQKGHTGKNHHAQKTSEQSFPSAEITATLNKNIEKGLSEDTAWKMLGMGLTAKQIDELSDIFIAENKKESEKNNVKEKNHVCEKETDINDMEEDEKSL